MKTSDTYRFWLGLGLLGITGCAGPGFEPPFAGDDSTTAAGASERDGNVQTAAVDTAPGLAPGVPPATGPSQAATPGAGVAGGATPSDMAAAAGTAAAAPMVPNASEQASAPGAMMDPAAGEAATALDGGADAGVDCPMVALGSRDGCNVSVDWPVATPLPGTLALQVVGPDGTTSVLTQVAGVEACDSQGYYWVIAPGLAEAPMLVLCADSCQLLTPEAELTAGLECAAAAPADPGSETAMP